MEPRGTEFQRRVWSLLREIPYGETTTYGALALKLGNPRSVRAVGLANGRNPLPIVVPCHRVIGADGSLVGLRRRAAAQARAAGARGGGAGRIPFDAVVMEPVRKAAGIAFFLYCGFVFIFLLAYLLASTQFGLPLGPPIVAVLTVALACVAVTRLARRS